MFPPPCPCASNVGQFFYEDGELSEESVAAVVKVRYPASRALSGQGQGGQSACNKLTTRVCCLWGPSQALVAEAQTSKTKAS
jgi:hypothetical protein